MSLELKHYVYGHFRQDTGVLFYIGKGSGNRGFSKQNRNLYWKNVVKKASGFTVQIIASNLTNKEALNFEKTLICSFKKQHTDKLCNLTDGGDGVYNPSQETRIKQREAKLGKKLTNETKEKISKSLINNKRALGFKQTKETIEKRILKTTGAKRSLQSRENISKAKLAKNFKHSEETKAKISLSKKLKKLDK